MRAAQPRPSQGKHEPRGRRTCSRVVEDVLETGLLTAPDEDVTTGATASFVAEFRSPRSPLAPSDHPNAPLCPTAPRRCLLRAVMTARGADDPATAEMLRHMRHGAAGTNALPDLSRLSIVRVVVTRVESTMGVLCQMDAPPLPATESPQHSLHPRPFSSVENSSTACLLYA